MTGAITVSHLVARLLLTEHGMTAGQALAHIEAARRKSYAHRALLSRPVMPEERVHTVSLLRRGLRAVFGPPERLADW